MCVYCKAASTVLDTLWEDDAFRDFFYARGYELSDLGPLTHDVFVPAYLGVKRGLQGGELELLEAEIAQDVLGPLHDRASFRAAWETWDPATRDEFLREQSETKLGLLLVRVHGERLAEAYTQAFGNHHP
jgi:hypothetical protein